MELLPRHGSHHFANVKYGYVILAVSILYILYLWAVRQAYHRKWSQSGRSTSFARITKIPLTVKIVTWIGFTILLCFWNPHMDEFTIHIKRFGRFAYALLPLNIFLSIKPSPLPYNNYLELTLLHKWLSRLIIVCGLAHGIGFLIRWGMLGELFKSVRLWNFLGLVSFVLFSILFIVSIRPIRNRIYSLFYCYHIAVAWLTLPLITLHARPGVLLYTAICSALLVWQIFTRIRHSRAVVVKSVKLPESSGLMVIKLPRECLPKVFYPGSHLRLSRKISHVFSWIYPSHPYTIVSSASESNSVSLVVRKTAFPIIINKEYSLMGPFQSLSLNFFQTAENLCILCGGSGISLGIPIYNHFKHINRHSGTVVKLLWVTKNGSDLYVLEDLKVSGIEVYLTQDERGDSSKSGGDADFEQFLLGDDELRHDDLDENLSDEDVFIHSDTREDNIIHYGSRPNLRNAFGKTLSSTPDNANKWVVACGPNSLIKDGRKFAKDMKVQFFQEVYSM